MSDRGIANLLGFLRRRVAQEPDLTPDGELLGRYAQTRDEPAFELLVRRHGAMVHGVGRRVLRDDHSADDVLQATFLTLARKAHTLRKHDSIAGWLYRVALRISFRALPKAPPTVPRGQETEQSPEIERQELRSILDEEIDRLPARQRQAVLLCYLTGHTTEEAARKLGCPRGTVLSRLSSARAKLQTQLTRRGITLPAAGLTTLLASETAPAVLPAALVALAMQAAGPVTALTPNVLTLAHGVIHAMMMTKLKVGLALVLAVGALGVGAGHWMGPGPATADEPKAQAKKSDALALQVVADAEARKRAESKRQELLATAIDHLQKTSDQEIKLRMEELELDEAMADVERDFAVLKRQRDLSRDNLMTLRSMEPPKTKDKQEQYTIELEKSNSALNRIQPLYEKVNERRKSLRIKRLHLLDRLVMLKTTSAWELARLERALQRLE